MIFSKLRDFLICLVNPIGKVDRMMATAEGLMVLISLRIDSIAAVSKLFVLRSKFVGAAIRMYSASKYAVR